VILRVPWGFVRGTLDIPSSVSSGKKSTFSPMYVHTLLARFTSIPSDRENRILGRLDALGQRNILVAIFPLLIIVGLHVPTEVVSVSNAGKSGRTVDVKVSDVT
jgi:hypothetical protein